MSIFFRGLTGFAGTYSIEKQKQIVAHSASPFGLGGFLCISFVIAQPEATRV